MFGQHGFEAALAGGGQLDPRLTAVVGGDGALDQAFAGQRLEDGSTPLRKGDEKIHGHFFDQSSFASLAIAKAAAEAIVVGDPAQKGVQMGPVASRAQFEKVQGLIRKGINEGATLVTGGLGQPEGLEQGWYVRPTVFGHVRNDMSIAREEIFGPVLCIIPYQDEADAVRIANDTPYGLAAYVQSGELEHARRVGAQIRAGNVHCNTYQLDIALPFGGFKQSGIGREGGVHSLEFYTELRNVMVKL